MSIDSFQLKDEINRKINEEKNIKNPDKQQSNQPEHIEYGWEKGTLIPKFYNKRIDKWKNTRYIKQCLLFTHRSFNVTNQMNFLSEHYVDL